MQRGCAASTAPLPVPQRPPVMLHGWKWYWHRLRAMEPAEIRQRVAQRFRHSEDARCLPDFGAVPVDKPGSHSWPILPRREDAPTATREALGAAVAALHTGRWRLFGHLQVAISNPPKWQADPVSGVNLQTTRPGFRLNHRRLPPGSDIKVVWDLNRWQNLTRLAQAAWLLEDQRSACLCLEWLKAWQTENPPYRGWNWTSPLEAGIRLINFAWIDALLDAAGIDAAALDPLRNTVLPAHAWYTWRHRSFGSSANNHLLGELSGLLLAVSRWPALDRWCAPLDELQSLFEQEVLAQFAPDGGNREQALHYHRFAWELCWQAAQALKTAGRSVATAVDERLQRAADFFLTVQAPSDPWDFGDSDSATVVPLHADEAGAANEWYRWFADPATSPHLCWWMGEPPPPAPKPACLRAAGDWLVYPDSGQAVCWTRRWLARWDLSPLGYLRPAAHAHLDALHLSLWLDDTALIIDPGTGAYFADPRLRNWLASWDAHNGPHPLADDFPRRLGAFLWEGHHEVPTWTELPDAGLRGELRLSSGTVRREIRRVHESGNDGWRVDDLFTPSSPRISAEFMVAWQFAPGTQLEPEAGNPRFYQGNRGAVRFTVGFDAAWRRVEVTGARTVSDSVPVEGHLRAICSPEFRRMASGPCIALTAPGTNPTLYRTTFMSA